METTNAITTARLIFEPVSGRATSTRKATVPANVQVHAEETDQGWLLFFSCDGDRDYCRVAESGDFVLDPAPDPAGTDEAPPGFRPYTHENSNPGDHEGLYVGPSYDSHTPLGEVEATYSDGGIVINVGPEELTTDQVRNLISALTLLLDDLEKRTDA